MGTEHERGQGAWRALIALLLTAILGVLAYPYAWLWWNWPLDIPGVTDAALPDAVARQQFPQIVTMDWRADIALWRTPEILAIITAEGVGSDYPSVIRDFCGQARRQGVTDALSIQLVGTEADVYVATDDIPLLGFAECDGRTTFGPPESARSRAWRFRAWRVKLAQGFLDWRAGLSSLFAHKPEPVRPAAVSSERSAHKLVLARMQAIDSVDWASWESDRALTVAVPAGTPWGEAATKACELALADGIAPGFSIKVVDAKTELGVKPCL